MWGLSCSSSLLIFQLSQPNILIDSKGSPRLSDFGLCSITKNIDSANASTANRGFTVRYCAPEILDAGGVVEVEKRKPTNKSDVYSLSMVIVEACEFSESMIRPGSDRLRFQLATGKVPFFGRADAEVTLQVFQSRRPQKPHRFEAPGMTLAVWKIAEKCWHQKAKERPEAQAVLRDLEDIAKTGGCTHSACICLPWELIDPQLE